jgi:TolB-like protein/tRNA A-37 threonylcarbamoyl transferase component Bud32
MMPDDAELHQLASAIAEGAKVDWESTESGAADESIRPVIRELAVIAAISDVHSSVPLAGEPLDATSEADSSPEMLAMWGTFRLLEKVGEGAYGEVYRAWDTRLDREVALKLLPPGFGDEAAPATSIIEEGRLLARVRHPNVVTIYGAERIDNRIGLWMEFVRGRTLEQILEQETVLNPSEAVEISLELCRAVSAVHGAGLLHRDIKAHNVMRSEDGRIALMDFGTGRKLDADASLDLAGTPLYLAPEVLLGQQATTRSDLYSLGVVLFRLVTGSYPVQGRTVREIRSAHEGGQRTAVQALGPDVPPKLARIIERAIDPRPERRYESADALAAELAALLPRPKIVRLAWAAGVVAAVILVVGAGWEIVGRQVGSWRTPSALFMGFTPVDRPIIAVLPFKNLSAEPDSDYFVEGLRGEIIRDLALVQGLQVLSSTSSFTSKDQPRNLRHIGERLGANLIVEGSVLRAGRRLRIHAQLVQVASGAPVWAEQFDRELEDIFRIQDDISGAIVNKLRLTLRRDGRRQDTNADTYDWYLRGRALVDRSGVPSARMAAELFERAIARDPEFAPAHAGLAIAYAFLTIPYRGIPYEVASPIMRRAAVKALQLDPQLGEAHTAMGLVYALERDWGNAEQEFQQSIRLDPSRTQTFTSYSISTLLPLQKYDEALRLLNIALRHDPLSLNVQREIGIVQMASGRYAAAIETFQRVREVDPDFAFVQTYLARALILEGRVEEALPLWQSGAIWPIHAYVRMGKRTEAEKLAAEHARYPYRMVIIATAMGDTPRAIEALEQTMVSEPHRVPSLLVDPELAALRDHPRVVAIRRELNLP